MKNCLDLQNYLSDGDLCDIVASELYEELLVFRHTVNVIRYKKALHK